MTVNVRKTIAQDEFACKALINLMRNHNIYTNWLAMDGEKGAGLCSISMNWWKRNSLKCSDNPTSLLGRGGIGTRFGHSSRRTIPKELLDICWNGVRSLLQETYDRFKEICRSFSVVIITYKKYLH